ncbi:MAG: beta-lactamase family protein, partial [Spirochaetaceae bacterium]|nr:beta-lactamase family protein [Spirochaetaceae bacterium]
MEIDEQQLQHIQAVLDEAVSSQKFAGNSCLVYQGGKIRGFWASGFSRKEGKMAFARDTICRIFSMTKPVTSAAAWILIERGKIDLASPVSDFLSEFKNLSVCDGEKIVPCRKPLLVRDLLNMTS